MKQFERRLRSEKALLHAASELIDEVGCSKTTLSMIMNRTGLSKGAIYHYIKSKDDLLAMVLEEKIQETNETFLKRMGSSGEDLMDPANVLAESFSAMNDPSGIVNQILLYFTGRNDTKTARNALRAFDHYMVEFSRFWILSGQKNGVISSGVDAGQTAEFLVVMASGLRMRNIHGGSDYVFEFEQFHAMMKRVFKGKPVLVHN